MRERLLSRPTRVRHIATAIWVRALPALAGIGWLTAATSGVLAAAALLDCDRHAVRAPRVAAAVMGVPLCAAGVLQAVAGTGSALEPLVAVSVAGYGVAMLTVRIWLRAATEAACLRVRVTDDGVSGADPGGRGLRGLSARLAEHGGRLHVLSEERGGTTVVAELPLDDSQRAAAARRQVEAAG